MVVAGRVSGIKIPWGAWLDLLMLSNVAKDNILRPKPQLTRPRP